jgi:hypothetical protein
MAHLTITCLYLLSKYALETSSIYQSLHKEIDFNQVEATHASSPSSFTGRPFGLQLPQ